MEVGARKKPGAGTMEMGTGFKKKIILYRRNYNE